MIDTTTGAMCERITSHYYSNELRVIITTGQRHRALPPDAKPHLPYGLPEIPKGSMDALLHNKQFQAEIDSFIASRMSDPNRRAYISFTPYHLLHENKDGPSKASARLFTPDTAAVTLLVNPKSRHLEAYDHMTMTVSEFPVRNLDPHVAFDVLAICETPAASLTYQQGMAQVMNTFDVRKNRVDGLGF